MSTWSKVKAFFSKQSNVSFFLAACWVPVLGIGIYNLNPITIPLGVAFLGMNLFTGFMHRRNEKLWERINAKTEELFKSFKVPPDAQ
jgi:hypothetical protein